MRVCFVWSDVTAVGGVSTWIAQCLAALPPLGVEAHAINVSGCATRPGEINGDRLTYTAPPHRYESPACFRRRLQKAIDKFRPDVLILNEQLYAWGFLQAVAGRAAVVNVVHSDRDSAYPIFLQLLQWGVPQWCVSRVIVSKLKARAPVGTHGMIKHTLLGVPEPQEPLVPTWKPGEVLQLGYVGRIARYQKQIEDLPSFALALKRKGIAAQVNVVGDGPDLGWLRGVVESHGLQDMVRFQGALSHEEAMEQLRRQHVFLLFSNFEGLPLTLLEAMIRGVVPVVTDLPSGISEVVEDGVNGCLFPVGQVDVAVERIEELTRQPEVFEQMRNAAVTTARRYSFDHQLAHFVDLFKESTANIRPAIPPREGGWLREHLPMGMMKWWDGGRKL